MHPVSETEFDGFSSRPDFSAEKSFAVTDESIAATVVDVRLEVLVKTVQQVLEDGHVFCVHRTERVVHQLVGAGGEDPSFDAQFCDGIVKTEGGRDHTDAADHRTKRIKQLQNLNSENNGI